MQINLSSELNSVENMQPQLVLESSSDCSIESKVTEEVTIDSFANEQNRKNENLFNFTVPELSELEQFNYLFTTKEQQIITKLASLQQNLPSFFLNLSLEQLEQLATDFIGQELAKSDLLSKIMAVNQQVEHLLSEIKFFQGGAISFIGGFFSSAFSKEDQKKWGEIEQLLSSVYGSENGLLRQVQDHFLFKVSNQQLTKLISRESISLDEELFLRGLLLKAYLVNFRQLIYPFYNVSGTILIDFKNQRISQLEKQKTSVDQQTTERINHEITLLSKQVIDLQERTYEGPLTEQNLQHQQTVSQQATSSANTGLNTGSIVLGSIETIRYLTSAIGHKTGIQALQKVGTIGAKAGGFLAKCLPFVSVAVEAGTQMK